MTGDGALQRKARGAFFTPSGLCSYVCDWAVRTPADRVLEPSCGQAAFLVAAAQRLDVLKAPVDPEQLVGIEVHAESAATAQEVVAAAGRPARVRVGDFFAVPGERRFDAVIGNPPYVRYQGFTGASRVVSRQAALQGGVGLTALASSWAAFTVHAAEFLRPGGRLGLVLPAELLTVNYAAEVRRYLMERFGRVRLVVFTERVFPGVLEEVVLLLAEDALAPGGTDHCELHHVVSTAELAPEPDGKDPGGTDTAHRWWPADRSGKWTPALLPASALQVYTPLVAGDGFTGLQTWGETTLGAVTGSNRYFAISPGQAGGLRLTETETVPLSPPGSRHLRGLSLSAAAWRALGATGSRTLLFRPGPDRAAMSTGARRYLAQGEADGVPEAYKCRVRSPWWQVPLVAPADLLLTYMNADTPRLTTNSAGVRHLNSVHGVYLGELTRDLGRELLPLASLNSLTLLGAELVGRAYGGGILKIEPREADQLPVPTPAVVAACRTALAECRPAVRAALGSGELLAAVRLVDQVLLRGHLGLDAGQHAELVAAHALLTARR
ncbi:MAG: N-6 DNA methylase, partial [Pseudonocardiaceae bacterium]